MAHNRRSFHWLWLVLVLAGVFVLYVPGLHSVFLLDDPYILRDLGSIPTVGISNFIFKGETGPTGRPIALLSFALQAQQWPDPFWFKLFNLSIHLVNGILIYILCRLISREVIQCNKDRTVFCLLIAGIWLIHPVQMTTVLYVIQRMTLLSTTFILLAVIIYLHSWKAYSQGNKKKALSGLLISFAVLMPLSIYSKEIGILTGLYVYSLYLTLLENRDRDRFWHLTTTVIALLPVTLVLVWYLITTDFTAAYAHRPFTVYERLFTEPAILFDYLRKILVPLPGHFSLFYDDYPVTHSLLSSPGTFLSFTGILALVLLAGFCRRRYPVAAFAVLWFFGGHVLESGFISLELYFEHRNYLPSLGVIYFAVWCLFRIGRWPGFRIPAVILTIVYSGLILVAALTESALWSYPEEQAFVWKVRHPKSTRALENLWDTYVRNGQLEKTEAVYNEYRTAFPRNIYPLIRHMYEQGCYFQTTVDESEWDRINRLAPAARYQGYSVQRFFYDMLNNYFNGTCKITDPGNYAGLLVEIARNNEVRHQRGNLYELATIYYVLSANREQALVNINRAIQYNPSVNYKLTKIRLLIGLGKTAQAKRLQDSVENELANDVRKRLIYGKQLDHIVIEQVQQRETNERPLQ